MVDWGEKASQISTEATGDAENPCWVDSGPDDTDESQCWLTSCRGNPEKRSCHDRPFLGGPVPEKPEKNRQLELGG